MNARFVNNRRELKYHVDMGGLEIFVQRAGDHLVMDANSPLEGYVVHSIYFDDADLTFYNEKMAELATRMKPRLRAYSDRFGAAPGAIFLEFKYREEGRVSKERVRLDADQARRLVAGDPGPGSLEVEDCPVMAKFNDLHGAMGLAPLIGVRYHRLAYTDADPGGIRLTFDRRIECTGLAGFDVPAARFVPLLRPDRAVVEVKFADAPPTWLTETVDDLGLEPNTYSKYANSVQRIHHPEMRAIS